MIFRQLFDPDSSTYTYILADEESREALIIDPVRDQVERDVEILEQLGLKLRYSLDTHVHADHITAGGVLRRRLGVKTVLSKNSGTACPDVLVGEGDTIRFGKYSLEVRETPGHTNGCLTYVTGDRKMAFTGDALLIRGSGRTDFQQGDPHKLFHSVREKIFTLPDETLLYPGHDYKGRTVSSVGEEKKYNARLSLDKTEEEFVRIMEDLNLAYPKKIDVSLPANLKCGLSAPEVATGEPYPERAWAPIERNADGVPEIAVEWVREHGEEVRLVDVREPEEFNGELGRVPGSELIPIEVLREKLAAMDREEPLVLICRTGRRSGLAAADLEKHGFKRVASMRGGMSRWNDAGAQATQGAACGA